MRLTALTSQPPICARKPPTPKVSGAALRQLVAPHGWGSLAGRVDTPARPPQTAPNRNHLHTQRVRTRRHSSVTGWVQRPCATRHSERRTLRCTSAASTSPPAGPGSVACRIPGTVGPSVLMRLCTSLKRPSPPSASPSHPLARTSCSLLPPVPPRGLPISRARGNHLLWVWGASGVTAGRRPAHIHTTAHVRAQRRREGPTQRAAASEIRRRWR